MRKDYSSKCLYKNNNLERTQIKNLMIYLRLWKYKNKQLSKKIKDG